MTTLKRESYCLRVLISLYRWFEGWTIAAGKESHTPPTSFASEPTFYAFVSIESLLLLCL